MFKRLFYLHWFYPLILITLTLFIAFKNYTPGTFLTGWDTLHPEFNFPLNFQRLIFGVWRADQGLGAVSGHSAMADLPRVFILWLFHYILPLSALRYSYVFLCLIIGPLSFFYLIRQLLPRHPGIALISSLAYLLNFGTLQQFYVPFEMFPTQWALLPLIILLTIRCLQHPSKKHFTIFFLVNLLATPQAYAAHLWYPFFGLLAIFFILWSKTNRRPFKLPLTLILLTLAANSFWLLPNLYYVAANSQIPQQNKSNRLNSQHFLERNRETGTLTDTSLIKGFYFNWDSFDFVHFKPNKLMPVWREHSSLFDIKIIGNLIFLASTIGLISVIISHHPLFFPLVPFFLIPFALLANNMPLFRNLFDWFLTLPLLSEIFRFIFTKMSILFTFGLNLFFAYFLYLIFIIKSSPFFKKKLGLLVVFSLLIYCYPYFQGQLISPQVKLNIPKDYFSLFKAAANLPQGRALTLPLHQPSGWQYYSWNYQGSGFIWFGLPFGTLDRDSDRWAQTNEEAYREFNYSLYSGNLPQFLLNLQKYQINYLVWDTTNISTAPKNQSQITLVSETNLLLQNLVNQNQIKLVSSIGSLSLYEINQPNILVATQNLFNNVLPIYTRNYLDSAFTGTNYLSQNISPASYYPFRNLLSPTDRINLNQFRLVQANASWYLTDLTSKASVELTPFQQYKTSDIKNLVTNPFLKSTQDYISFFSFNSTNGIQINLPQMEHSTAYIIGFKSKYIKGIPLRFCLFNYYSNLCSFEDELSKNSEFRWDYFFIPPMDSFSGYDLRLNSISYNFRPNDSQVSDINMFSVDFSQINTPSLYSQTRVTPTNAANYQVIWPNNSLVKINQLTPSSHLLFFQSYSPGWLAFYFDNLKPVFLKDHVLVNNWANGWSIPPSSPPIYILFWPQLLEFAGFAIISITVVLILILHPFAKST